MANGEDELPCGETFKTDSVVPFPPATADSVPAAEASDEDDKPDSYGYYDYPPVKKRQRERRGRLKNAMPKTYSQR